MWMRTRIGWLLPGLIALGASLAAPARGQIVRAERIASGFERPVALVSPPGESRRIFVAEQHSGAIRIQVR